MGFADADRSVFFAAPKMWYTWRMRALASLRTARPARGDRLPDYRFVLAAIVVLAFGLRLARLTFQPLWWDEGWSLYFAASDVPTLLELTSVDIHPPLYYLLLRLWMGLAGSGIVAVRLFSVLIGTATVPLLFVVGRRLLGRSGGLLAAALLAISPLHVYYSQEVRMYGLVTLLGLAVTYFALRWSLDAGPAWGSLLGYVLAAAAALHTQYYAGFLLLGLNLALAIHWQHRRLLMEMGRRRLLAWLAAQGAVLLLFVPWLWYAAQRLAAYVGFKVGVEKDVSMGLFAYLGRHLAAFTWGHLAGLEGWWWLGLLPLAALLGGLALGRWLRRGATRQGRAAPGEPAAPLDDTGRAKSAGSVWAWAGAVMGVVLVCGFVVNLALPFNPPRTERLLLLAQPAYLLLVAGGLLALWRARRALALLPVASWLGLALFSLAIFYAVPRYPQDDYRPVADQLRRQALPGDAIVCVHPWQVGYFLAYLPNSETRPSLILTPRQVLPRERQLWAEEPVRLAADLDALLAVHSRLWVPAHQAMGRVLEDRIATYLADHAYPVTSKWYGENTVLALYAAGQPVASSASGTFGPWLSLDGASLGTGPFEAGWGIVPVDLTWRVLAQPAEPYQVGLRLLGATGHVWAQRDTPPVNGLAPFAQWPLEQPGQDRHGLLVPAGTPPGEYRLTLQVYRSRDLVPLPVTAANGSGGELTLGTVRIVRPAVWPPPEALGLEQNLEADFGPLHLWGVTFHAGQPVLPGQAAEVELFWQAQAAPGEDLLPRLQLWNGEQMLAEWLEKPVAGTYPTAWWQAGELVCDPHSLYIPATVPPGRYRLTLSLVRDADGQPLPAKGKTETLDVGQVEVQGRVHEYTPPTPQHKQVAAIGASVELMGYDLGAGSLAPGSSVEVTLYWHALETPVDDYHAFVHLLDVDGNIVAQHDGVPGEGRLPTLGWLPGEYLADRHLLQLPTGLAPGEYRLAVGLYQPSSWQRPAEPVVLDVELEVGG
jgi:4-amino-4-deoxy-L-arabinose transferase-like glycosyltransferase